MTSTNLRHNVTSEKRVQSPLSRDEYPVPVDQSSRFLFARVQGIRGMMTRVSWQALILSARVGLCFRSNCGVHDPFVAKKEEK